MAKYLLFVWKPSGYELREADGDVPGVGSEVEQDGQKQRVTYKRSSALSAATRPKTSAAARPLAYPPVDIPPTSAPAA